jgi:hypothetical protein
VRRVVEAGADDLVVPLPQSPLIGRLAFADARTCQSLSKALVCSARFARP